MNSYQCFETFEGCETLELEYQPFNFRAHQILHMFPNVREVSLMMKNLRLDVPHDLSQRHNLEKYEIVAFNFANKHAVFTDAFKILTDDRCLKEVNINLYKATLAATNVFQFLSQINSIQSFITGEELLVEPKNQSVKEGPQSP